MADRTPVAERLHAIIEKVAPTAHAYHEAPETKGQWMPRPVSPTDEMNLEPRAPYLITTTKDNKIRLTVYDDEGGSVVGLGDTVEAAVAAVEGKLGIISEGVAK